MSKTILSGLFILSLAAACGGDDDSGAPTQTNPASASATVTQLNAFGDAFATADGASAAGAAYGIGASASAIVSAAPEAAQRRIDGTWNATGTCECDESGCTFTDCGDDSGIWVINGSISVSGDTYSFDLDQSLNTAGIGWTWLTDGDITISDTMIDGEMAGDGEGMFDNQGQMLEYAWSWDITSVEIALDDAGCAVDGTMEASVSYEASSSEGSGSFSGSGSVAFGPTCGEATAE